MVLGFFVLIAILEEQEIKEYALMKKKNKSLSKLKKKAIKIHSEYIRRKAANEDGFAECVTCGKIDHWKRLQNGHFIPGRTNSVLFADYNCHVQCYRCNVLMKGNWTAYLQFMRKTYGMEIVDHLISLKNQTKVMTVQDYEDLIELYKNHEN